jgi:hypothetical protein
MASSGCTEGTGMGWSPFHSVEQALYFARHCELAGLMFQGSSASKIEGDIAVQPSAL